MGPLDQQTTMFMPSKTQIEIISNLKSNKKCTVLKKIMVNNILCCGINICGGTMFSIPTLFNLSFCGYVLGFQIYDITYIQDKSIRKNSLLRILPHSFEIVGIWISGSLSFYITWLILYFLQKKSLMPSSVKILIKYSIIMTSIIILAAIIETYISSSI